jgi:hypothetical protein
MSKQKRPSTITAQAADSQVLRFVSRAQQLRLRGSRNYSRYMRLTKGFVDPYGPERAQWQRESAEDVVRDAAWDQRHGSLPGGARIVQWRQDAEQRLRHSSSDAQIR